MSPSPYPIFSVSLNDKPEKIRIKIKLLIRLYLKDPNQLVAKSVATHIAAMLADPEYIKDAKQRCLFRKLEMHWRCLAWVGNDAISQRKKQLIQPKSLSLQLEMEMN
ncbi:MAG: hypothetical protein L3J59_13975 [Methylococcaceae bacterium]|nr:hypothetical protein [Methylococcaceae bacterium]